MDASILGIAVKAVFRYSFHFTFIFGMSTHTSWAEVLLAV